MKIAILGPAPPFRGGISLFALMLARSYAELGHEVAFFNFKHQYPKLLFPGKNQTDTTLNETEFPNFRTLTPWLPFSWWQTAKAIKGFQADLLIVSWFLPFFAPAYGVIQRLLPKLPKIVLAHNVVAHERWAFTDLLTRFCFQPATKIVVLSKATLQELKHNLPLNIARKGVLGFHPIYNCYEVNHSVSTPKTDATNLLFFGLIKPYKGLDVLLAAMPLVLTRFPLAKLIVAGEVYGDSAVYTEQIHSLGIGASVETHFRYIGDPEISLFFSKASLCILPYKSASQSGVIATSYSFGVPVLASDVGGLGEYVLEGKTGYLVPPNEPKLLAEAIVKHLKDKTNFSESIAEYRSNYSWKRLAEIMLTP